MAFSTQKEFFHVPFMNETLDFECQETCVKLKSYPSTNDDRSWAADEDKKSRFVADLVACNTPIYRDGGAGPDGRGGGRPGGAKARYPVGADGGMPYGSGWGGQKAQRQEDGRGQVPVGQGPGGGRGSRSGPGAGQGGPGQGGAGPGGRGPGRPGGPGSGGDPMVGDSLISAADDTIENMRALMVQNNLLEKKLADSNDRLVTAKVQNEEIKRIMNQRYDPEKSKKLKDKIQELSNSGKIGPNDAKELEDIQKSIDDMNKAHDILEVENANLRRLIEKQSTRCAMDSIKIDPEKSNDVNYLQNKIDNMGKELALLRQAEDDFIRAGGATQGGGPNGVEMDIDNIQQMLAERDALRRKIKALGMLENKINKLQKSADQANTASGDLAKSLNAQNNYINDMENDMQEMQKYYEHEIDTSKYNEEVLKCRCRELQHQVISLQPAANRCECQQNEIDVMRNELRKRDVALNAYDCQYQQLMGVICELNKKYGNQHGDCPSFTVPACPDIGDDLAFYTGATLEHIMHELCRQAECFKHLNQTQESGDPKITNIQDCTQEMERLRSLLKQKDSQLGNLIEENECMCEAALQSNQRLNQLDQKVRDLDRDTRYMEDGMRQSIDLIQDIGDVARQNEKLKDNLANMRHSELQLLTDDLRKQLEDCMKSKQQCEAVNNSFREALRDLGANPDEIEREAKNKLEAQRKAEEAKKSDEAERAAGKEGEGRYETVMTPTGMAQRWVGAPGEEEKQKDRTPSELKKAMLEGDKTGEPGGKPGEIAGAAGGPGAQPGDTTGAADAKAGETAAGAKPGETAGGPGAKPGDTAGGPGAKAGEDAAKTGAADAAGSKPGDMAGAAGGPGAKAGEDAAKTGAADAAGSKPGDTAGAAGAAGGPGGKPGEDVGGAGAKAGDKTGAAGGPGAKAGEDGAKAGDKPGAAGGPGAKAGEDGAKAGDKAGAAGGPGAKAGAADAAGSKPGDSAGGAGGPGGKAGEDVGGAGAKGGDKTGAAGGPGAKAGEDGAKAGDKPGAAGGPGAKAGEDGAKAGDKPGAAGGPGGKAGVQAGASGGTAGDAGGAAGGKAGDAGGATGGKAGDAGGAAGAAGAGAKSGAKAAGATGAASGRPGAAPGTAAEDGTGGERAGGKPLKPGEQGAAGKQGTGKGAPGGTGKGAGRHGMKGSKLIDDTTEEQFEQFVKNTVKTLSAGEIDGVGLERELRKILDMFIDECGFCFCKCNIPKSRFYAICHKLYHHGLHTLDFKDLAYMHKRIFAAAENILPGCLFNMIMKDFIAVNPQSLKAIKTASHPSKPENQCCTCKNALCCDDTEEKLIVKVMRLENDIENAKQCLKNLKSIPSDISIHDYRMEAGDCVASERVLRSPREAKSIAIYKQIKQTRRTKKAFAAIN